MTVAINTDDCQRHDRVGFMTFRTLKIGTHKNVNDLSITLASNGVRISDWAADLLKCTPLAEKQEDVELVLVTVADLGFMKETSREALYNRALESGLDLVPAEVGPELLLAYNGQRAGEWMVMAMGPIAASSKRPSIYGIGRNKDGDLFLGADYGYPDLNWGPEVRWVFARRKQS